MMDGLTAGRIVHYVTAKGKHRAAVVNSVADPTKGLLNLTVYSSTDDLTPIVYREDKIPFSDAQSPNTWHWVEKA